MENNRLDVFSHFMQVGVYFQREDNILIIRFNPNLIHANFNLKLPDIQESKNFANRKQFQFTNFYFSDLSSFYQTSPIQIFPIMLGTSEP